MCVLSLPLVQVSQGSANAEVLMRAENTLTRLEEAMAPESSDEEQEEEQQAQQGTKKGSLVSRIGGLFGGGTKKGTKVQSTSGSVSGKGSVLWGIGSRSGSSMDGGGWGSRSGSSMDGAEEPEGTSREVEAGGGGKAAAGMLASWGGSAARAALGMAAGLRDETERAIRAMEAAEEASVSACEKKEGGLGVREGFQARSLATLAFLSHG